MRRSSVIGPLILIAIGTMFLLKNLRPELPIVDFLARAWPFILIAWGGMRLVELLWWFSRSQPLPVNGLSGGEWLLVTILSMAGSGLYVAQNRADWLSNAHFSVNGIDLFNDAYQYPIAPSSAKAGKATKLLIENFRGDAQITGADTNEVRLAGKKKIRAGQQSTADRIDGVTPIELIVQGNEIIVRCNQERAKENSRISESLEIVVPKAFAVEARGRYGDFDVRDTTGPVDIRSDNAGIRLDNLAGPVKVYTRKSDIIRAVGLKNTLDLSGGGSDVELENILGQVTITGSYSGSMQLRALAKPVHVEGQQLEFRAESVPGEVRSSLSDFTGSNIVGPVRLSSKRSRDVRLSEFTQSLQVDISNGNVTLEPAQKVLSKLDVQVRNGDIELVLPAQAAFSLNATTSRGETNTEDWGEQATVTSGGGGRGASIAFSSGQGQRPDLAVHTEHGNLTLRKAEASQVKKLTAAPVPPVAPEPPGVPVPAKPQVRVE